MSKEEQDAAFYKAQNKMFATTFGMIFDALNKSSKEIEQQRERRASCGLCGGSGEIEVMHSYVGGYNMPPGHVEVEGTGKFLECPECGLSDYNEAMPCLN